MGGPSSRQGPGPAWLVGVAWSVLGVGLLVLLLPVLLAPVTADDRVWYPEVVARTGGSPLEAVRWSFEEMPERSARDGRVVVLALLARRLLMIPVYDAAVATALPVHVVQGGLKLGLLAAGVLSCWAFLRVVRTRDRTGRLVRLPRSTAAVVTVLLTVLLASGTQLQVPHRNGWVSYAILTYGAVVVIMGSVALMVWLTRRAASGGPTWMLVGVGAAVLLAMVLNTSYELYYVAVPLVVVAVLQQPLTGPSEARRARAARWTVASTFTVGFVVIFGGIRLWIRQVCVDGGCYRGSTPELGGRTLLTGVRNLAGAVPVFGRTELRDDLTAVGIRDQMPGLVTPLSLVVALVVAAATTVVVSSTASAGRRGDDEAVARDARRLLLLAAGVPLAAAVGTALVMGLSSLSADIVVSLGVPYRSTMVTWTMLSLTAAMTLTSVCLVAPAARLRRLGLGAAALVVTLLAAFTLTQNLPALRAARLQPTHQAATSLQWEIVLGDLSPSGEARRCAALDDLRASLRPTTWHERAAVAADGAFRHYHGQSYCSETP